LEVIKSELKSIGFNEIEHFKSPADGKTKAWDYTAPYQWELESGILKIIEPEKMKLCDSNEITTSIITHSKSCDILVEIIDIGKGNKKEDYQKKDLEGIIVLISSPTYRCRSLIENSKAIGVIFYPDPKFEIKTNLKENLKIIFKNRNYLSITLVIGISGLAWSILVDALLAYNQAALFLSGFDFYNIAVVLLIGIFTFLFIWRKILEKGVKKKTLLLIFLFAIIFSPISLFALIEAFPRLILGIIFVFIGTGALGG
jgi:hypothetical protein